MSKLLVTFSCQLIASLILLDTEGTGLEYEQNKKDFTDALLEMERQNVVQIIFECYF